MSGNFAIKGGGRTPNGKCHLKFPFWLFEPFHNFLCMQQASIPQRVSHIIIMVVIIIGVIMVLLIACNKPQPHHGSCISSGSPTSTWQTRKRPLAGKTRSFPCSSLKVYFEENRQIVLVNLEWLKKSFAHVMSRISGAMYLLVPTRGFWGMFVSPVAWKKQVEIDTRFVWSSFNIFSLNHFCLRCCRSKWKLE